MTLPSVDSVLHEERARTVFIISPQPWEGFKVSKHHYAVALAREGWTVFFIDPPLPFSRRRGIKTHPTDVDGVCRVDYSLPLPSWTKFKLRSIFNLAMRRQARRLTARLGRPDLVWDFDNAYQFNDLRAFGGSTTIFHLVDRGVKGLGDKSAELRVHLHPSFCEWAGYRASDSIKVGHGVSRDFIQHCPPIPTHDEYKQVVCIGLVGNLKASWFDWAAVEEIARRLPTTRFVLWGPHRDPGIAEGAEGRLLNSKRVSLRGIASPEQIAEDSAEVDLWLLPFVAERVPGGPLNSHKVLEYLATGKAVAMSWLEAYSGNGLVEMLDRDSGETLPDRVSGVLASLDTINSSSLMLARRSYASDRVYEERLSQILRVVGLWRE